MSVKRAGADCCLGLKEDIGWFHHICFRNNLIHVSRDKYGWCHTCSTGAIGKLSPLCPWRARQALDVWVGEKGRYRVGSS
jgi:hypothetical protein